MLHIAEPLTATGQAIVEAYLPADQVDRFNREGLHSIIERMQERLARFCEEETGICPDDSNLVSDVVVAHGQPADEIVRHARQYQADLIVMGSCSHHVLGHVSLGSTTRRVVQASTVPVLIVPNCRE
jgi:nucleotide-binding universal stress UspA family protein